MLEPSSSWSHSSCRAAQHGLVGTLRRHIGVAIVTVIQHEEIDLAIAVTKEDARCIGQSVGGVGPVLLEDCQGLLLDRISAVLVVHSEVMIVPDCEMGDGAQDGLQTIHIPLPSILLL